MFPGFNHSGVIPPFRTDPAMRDGSPYLTTLSAVVVQLGTSPERRALIEGLLNYRQALRDIGVTSGFQLLDGSFTEDCEGQRGRPPGDIDLVTYAYLPVSPAQIPAFVGQHLPLFEPAQVKASFSCDAYFVDMGKNAELVVDDTFYWYGLFSHQKVSGTWKGMLRIPLISDDGVARAALVNAAAQAGGAPNGA